MTRPMLAWGLGMCLLGTINVTIFGNESPHAPALLFGIGGAMVALAAVLAVTGLGRSPEATTQSLPDVSPPTTFAALGLVLMALGGVVGLWLVWIGGAVTATGAAGVVREARAQRRALRRAGARRPR